MQAYTLSSSAVVVVSVLLQAAPAGAVPLKVHSGEPHSQPRTVSQSQAQKGSGEKGSTRPSTQNKEPHSRVQAHSHGLFSGAGASSPSHHLAL